MKKYLELIKFGLTFLVVFTYVVCYYLAVPREEFSLYNVLLLSLAGFLVAGAGNAANQLYERKTDALMSRTKKRPLVTGSIKPKEAAVFIVFMLLGGLGILYFHFNLAATVTALVSFLLYVFVYTPMKRKNSLAVFVGAIPGALPCLIGWLAGSNSFSLYGWILFGIQFFWQFPHFWSLAWLVHEDYQKAGYHLLPLKLSPGSMVALQCFAFCLLLFLVSIMPYFLEAVYFSALWLIFIINFWLLWHAFKLIKQPTISSARKLMFSCYIYLPVIYLALVFFRKV